MAQEPKVPHSETLPIHRKCQTEILRVRK